MPNSSHLAPFSLCDARKGYGLIESVIVLAVVALVVGGIWTAAAAVIETMRINRSVAFVISVATAMQRNWRDAPWSGSMFLSSCVRDQGWAPRDFVNPSGYPDCTSGWQNPAYPYALYSPWGTPIQISSAAVEVSYGITFLTLPAHRCRRLIAEVSGRVGTSGSIVSHIYTWGAANVPASSFPISLRNASCPSVGGSNSVQFTIPR